MAAHPPEPSRTPETVRILVADDEESIRFFLERGLRKAGFAVELCSDGTEAWNQLRQGQYDAVLTDVAMPGLSGLEVLEAVHRHQKDCAVLIMTAYASVENAIDALRRGAFDYLTKPFEMNELLARLQKALFRRSSEGAQREARFRIHSGEAAAGNGQMEESPTGLADARKDFERRFIEGLLRQTRGNVTRAAELAKISRANLHKKIRALNVNPGRFKPGAGR